MDRFPYTVIYRVTGNEVQILAVAHAKRLPPVIGAGGRADEIRRFRDGWVNFIWHTESFPVDCRQQSPLAHRKNPLTLFSNPCSVTFPPLH
ncbi:MAG: hypothetical protein KF712_15465 [Akkermansiaceae bacterium]|nr:hypothetical protein [Akkermansiaceae bacterium]